MTLHIDYSFFFNDTATTEIYTLSLHDALPIFARVRDQVIAAALGDFAAADERRAVQRGGNRSGGIARPGLRADRSEEHTSELQSQSISYAVFCLKKKKQNINNTHVPVPTSLST